jgi:hypothetical protein
MMKFSHCKQKVMIIRRNGMKNIRNMKVFRSIAWVSIAAACGSLLAASCSLAQESTAEPHKEVVLTSEVTWDHLNPK